MSHEFGRQSESRHTPPGLLRLPYQRELTGETIDLGHYYADSLRHRDLEDYLSRHLAFGEETPRDFLRGGAYGWQGNLFSEYFPEYWKETGKEDKRQFILTPKKVHELLEQPEIREELYRRVNHEVHQAGRQFHLVRNTNERQGRRRIAFASYDTIEEAIAGAHIIVAKGNLAIDLIRGANRAEDLWVLQWCIDKLILLRETDPDVLDDRLKGDHNWEPSGGGIARTVRWAILRAGMNFANRTPEAVDEVVELASNSLKQLNPSDRVPSELKHWLFHHVMRASAGNPDIQAAIDNNDLAVIDQHFSPQNRFRYRLARRDYPEIFTREYYLSQIKSCASTPVRPENITVFQEYQEMLSVIPKTYAGKFIADSIDLTRGILRGLAELSGGDRAETLEMLLKRTAELGGNLSPQTLMKLANKLLPQLPTSLSRERLQELRIDNIADFPLAIARIISYARAAIKVPEPEAGQEASNADDVYDYASQCAIMMAEIGASNKLQQEVLTLGDLAVRYPKLSPIELRELAESMQKVTKETNVQLLYRELRARNKSHVGFKKQEPGKGLLS
jgi:hypothetical protein